MFDKEWFIKHQKILLWLANNWLGRRILCINGDRSSVGKNKVIRIDPNAITWIERVDISYSKNYKEIKIQPIHSTEFRTHNKFSKRLYYAFKPLWHLLHFWDILFANNFNPAFNLGFDDFRPDANPETNTVDGIVGRLGANLIWSEIRGATGNYKDDSGQSEMWGNIRGSGAVSKYESLKRAILLFNTAAIDDDITIATAILKMHCSSKINELNGEDSENSRLILVASNPASNTGLDVSDYVDLGTTHFGQSDIQANINTGAYNDIVLNATGIAAISRIGITKFGTRYGWDCDNTTTGFTHAINSRQAITAYFADRAGTAEDPTLVVTYPLPGAAILMAMIAV